MPSGNCTLSLSVETLSADYFASIPMILAQFCLDPIEVSVLVCDVDIWYLPALSQAKHLKTAHDAISELLVFEYMANMVCRSYNVCLRWNLGDPSLRSLLSIELLDIVRSHLGSYVVYHLVDTKVDLRKRT
jgi:hypothetical protein